MARGSGGVSLGVRICRWSRRRQTERRRAPQAAKAASWAAGSCVAFAPMPPPRGCLRSEAASIHRSFAGSGRIAGHLGARVLVRPLLVIGSARENSELLVGGG